MLRQWSQGKARRRLPHLRGFDRVEHNDVGVGGELVEMQTVNEHVALALVLGGVGTGVGHAAGAVQHARATEGPGVIESAAEGERRRRRDRGLIDSFKKKQQEEQ